MFVSDYDASVFFVRRIRTAEHNEEKAQKDKKMSRAKDYRNEAYAWMDAFSYYLQDLLCQRYPNKPLPMIAAHNVVELLKITDEKTTREQFLDALVKMLDIEK